MQQARTTFLLLTFILASFTAVFARDASKANDTLLRASSPFEDMVEFALARNDASISKSLTAADRGAAAVRDALPTPAAARFDTLLQTIRRTARAKEHYAVAVSAVEVFRLLIDNLDAESLKVPKEISLLDYAGFKLHVLAAAPQPDWGAMRGTAEDAAGWWAAIKSKVSDSKLRDAFSTTARGMQQAGKAEHLPMLDFAAQMDLDLVDLLERYFEGRK